VTRDLDHPSFRGPSWLWYIVGALLVIVPPAGGVYAITRVAMWIGDNTLEFDAPGSVTVNVEQPTTFTVWNEILVENESGIQKRTYVSPDDVVVTVTGPDGGALPLDDNPNMQIQTGGSNRMSLANVTIDSPGAYTFDVRATDEQTFGVAVSPGLGEALQAFLAKATPLVGAGSLMFLLGLVTLVVTFIRRNAANQRRKEAEYAEIAAGF
jgi:hypothetical protein